VPRYSWGLGQDYTDSLNWFCTSTLRDIYVAARQGCRSLPMTSNRPHIRTSSRRPFAPSHIRCPMTTAGPCTHTVSCTHIRLRRIWVCLHRR